MRKVQREEHASRGRSRAIDVLEYEIARSCQRPIFQSQMTAKARRIVVVSVVVRCKAGLTCAHQRCRELPLGSWLILRYFHS